MRGVVAATTLALCVSGCGAGHDEPNWQRVSIVDGEATTEYDAVVAIAPRRVQCADLPGVLCSGTLVAPNAVLSAAHCFASMRPGLAYEVFLGAALGPEAQAVSVTEVLTHPGFDEETRARDVAVLWLGRSVDGVTPEPLPKADSRRPMLDDRVALVGFGATTAGSVPDGVKRVGFGIVGSVSAGTVSVDPEPSVSCVGDSGGPLFDGPDRALIGVASSGDTGCEETSVYALIAPTMRDFIEPALAMGPSSRPSGSGSCTDACTVDAECPAGFVCTREPEDQGSRCALPGQGAGILTLPCHDDALCPDGLCAVSEATAGCQCYEPCGATTGRASPGGCAVSDVKHAEAILWSLVLVTWVGIRLRG